MSANEVNLEEVVPGVYSKVGLSQSDRYEKNASWHRGTFEVGAADIVTSTSSGNPPQILSSA